MRIRGVRVAMVMMIMCVIVAMFVIVVVSMRMILEMMPVILILMTKVLRHFQRRGLGVAVNWRPRQTMLLAEVLIPAGGVAVTFARAILQTAADALDMVMVALLRPPDIRLKAKHLFAVLAHLAVHVV